MIKKKFFLENEYIFKKDLCFICNTNIFCIKIYFQITYIYFYIFIYIFLCEKRGKKSVNIKLFFHVKAFFLQIVYIS